MLFRSIQVFGVFDSCADDLGEPVEEVSARCGELVATDEPTVVPKPLPDAIVMEDDQSDRRFPDSPCANESDRSEVF